MAIADKVRVQEQGVVGVVATPYASLRVASVYAVAIGGLVAPYIFAHNEEVTAIAANDGEAAVLRVEEFHAVVVAAYGVLPEQPLVISAFPYDLDGHVFYGLHIRDRGTFVYDLMTGQWAQWKTADFPYWNAQFHVKWNDQFYASSLIDSTLVVVNPESVLDDSFRTNTFLATGRLESQSRRYIQNSEAQLFGSIGLRGGDVALRYSDDEGDTWSTDRVVTVSPGARDANVMFYDLGSVRAPGRIFQIEDVGTMRRIQTLNAIMGGEDGSNS